MQCEATHPFAEGQPCPVSGGPHRCHLGDLHLSRLPDHECACGQTWENSTDA